MSATSLERPFLYCYLYTAARVREIFRLRWQDVDFEKRKIRLYSRKNQSRTLKESALEIPGVLLEQLLWWYKTPDRLFKESPHVFVVQKGKFAGQPYKEGRWFMKSLCKRAGVKYFPLGDMRPLVASHLYEKGKETKKIQGQLRHERPSTTDRYLKTIVGSNPGMAHRWVPAQKAVHPPTLGLCRIMELVFAALN